MSEGIKPHFDAAARTHFSISGEKLDKYGWWLVMIAAATPVPYTLSLYLAGSTRWGNVTRTTTAVVVGKLLRYTVIAVITYYGYQLF